MKPQIKSSLILFPVIMLLLSSCRSEEMEFIQSPNENTLQANSKITSQLQRVSMNDGSNDNIIYNANCFNIQFPVTVLVNGLEITINSDDDYDDIEDIFDEFEDDDDSVVINFPITIILSDYTEVVINTIAELDDFGDDCNDENELDDDIECIDFVYPLTASKFNKRTEVITTITINNDNEMYHFIDDFDDDDDNDDNLVTFNFPINILLLDGSELTINNFKELETAIDDYGDDCDEDDDYDYNDDDCDSCSTNQLTDILTGCPDWIIEDLERNDDDLDDLYDGYLFNFLTNGTLTATKNGNAQNGTWSTSGQENNITVTISIAGLNDIHASWKLHEIDDNETAVDLEIDDDNELKFKNNNCN
jgi:hypothetical protein